MDKQAFLEGCMLHFNKRWAGKYDRFTTVQKVIGVTVADTLYDVCSDRDIILRVEPPSGGAYGNFYSYFGIVLTSPKVTHASWTTGMAACGPSGISINNRISGQTYVPVNNRKVPKNHQFVFGPDHGQERMYRKIAGMIDKNYSDYDLYLRDKINAAKKENDRFNAMTPMERVAEAKKKMLEKS